MRRGRGQAGQLGDEERIAGRLADDGVHAFGRDRGTEKPARKCRASDSGSGPTAIRRTSGPCVPRLAGPKKLVAVRSSSLHGRQEVSDQPQKSVCRQGLVSSSSSR